MSYACKLHTYNFPIRTISAEEIREEEEEEGMEYTTVMASSSINHQDHQKQMSPNEKINVETWTTSFFNVAQTSRPANFCVHRLWQAATVQNKVIPSNNSIPTRSPSVRRAQSKMWKLRGGGVDLTTANSIPPLSRTFGKFLNCVRLP